MTKRTPQTRRLKPPAHGQDASISVTTFIVVGLGNIGSHLADSLTRLGDSPLRLVLIDPDAYGHENLASQQVSSRDLGRPKVLVQAKRVKQIAPQVEVVAIRASVAEVPVGMLRAQAIFCCVDNRAARGYLGEAAWHLGVPLIDGAVDGDDLMARVGVYVPGDQGACLLCAWAPADFKALGQAYPCSAQRGVPTRAPAALGAITAGLMTCEASRLLGREGSKLPAQAYYIVCDARHHAMQWTKLSRNPRCPASHVVWPIEQIKAPPWRLTIGELLGRAGARPRRGSRNEEAAIWLPLPRKAFVRRLECRRCGHQQQIIPRLEGRLGQMVTDCPQCGRSMQANRFEMLDWLGGEELAEQVRRRTRLSRLGFVAGDVIAVSSARGVRYVGLWPDKLTRRMGRWADRPVALGAGNAASDTFG